jgi:aminoglycoside 3-N-acetyltransferase
MGHGLCSADLLRHLREHCQLREGDTLIVHSSLKSIGWVEGGASTVVHALRNAVGKRGTLLMPTFSDPQPSGCFYLGRTPSRTGLISEVFRTSPGVVRSRQPTHSVSVWGRLTDFSADHETTGPLGIDSPLHKAAQAGAKILMIGCGMTRCSLVHVAEAIVRVPYLGKAVYSGYERDLQLVDIDGASHVYSPRDVPGDSRAFSKVQQRMEQSGLIHHGLLGDARCLVFSGKAALMMAITMLREDPASLLCDNARCQVCPAARTFCRA